MSKVFVVLLDHDWANYHIEGVYDSQYKANEKKKQLMKDGQVEDAIKVEDWNIE